MNEWTTGGLVGLLIAGWCYNKLYRSTGSNAKVALAAAVGIWLVCLLVLGTFFGLFL